MFSSRGNVITLNLKLQIKQQDPKTVSDGMIQAKTSSTSDPSFLKKEIAGFESPERRLEALNLPGYNKQLWETFSLGFVKLDDAPPQTTLTNTFLEMLLNSLPQPYKQNNNIVNIRFNGDYKSFSQYAQHVASVDTSLSYHLVNWGGFCPDPYNPKCHQMQQFDSKSSLKHVMSDSRDFYDKHLNGQWIVGSDGTGLWTDENLRSMNPIAAIVFTDYERFGYLDYDFRVLSRAIISTLFQCQQAGSALVKFVIPHSIGVITLLNLFDNFFRTTSIIRIQGTVADDNTCYLLGEGFNLELMTPEMKTALMNFLNNPFPISEYLLRSTNINHVDLIKIYGMEIDSSISQRKRDWLKRNLEL